MSSETKDFCWSCGNSAGSCVCNINSEYPPQLINVRKPVEVLPICGVSGVLPKGNDASYVEGSLGKLISELGLPEEVKLRPCCACGESWPCSMEEQIVGRCPNCGASGSVIGVTSLNKSHEITKYPKAIDITFKKLTSYENDYTKKFYQEVDKYNENNEKFVKFH